MSDLSAILNDSTLAARSRQQRFNPLRGVTPASLGHYLDQFDLGHLRAAVLTWKEMLERDDTLVVAVPKMIRRVASRKWDVLIGEEVGDDQQAAAEAQQAVLKKFYSTLKCRNILEPDKQGGLKMLISAMMTAPLYRYALAGLAWEPGEDGMRCTAHVVPLELLAATQGSLRYAGVEYVTPGQPLGDRENLLIAVADTCLMKALSICYMFKRLPMSDALNFCQRFGIPGIHGETNAAPGSKEWHDFVDALRKFANDLVVATNVGAKINILENKAANGEAVFGWLIDAMKRAMVTICCGSDLATMSRENGTGASLQAAAADEMTSDYCEWISELFREQLDRRVLEWAFGEGVEPLAYFQLMPPANEDVRLEMEIDDHVKKLGVKMAVDDVAERYGRTMDANAQAAPADPQADQQAANEATLTALRQRAESAFAKGVKADLKPLIDGVQSLVNAEGVDATRNAALTLAANIASIEEQVLNSDASTAALEASLALELLGGLAGRATATLNAEPS